MIGYADDNSGLTARRKDMRITVRIPRVMVDELDKLARGNERTLSGELRYLIRRHLEEARCHQ